MCIQPKSCFEDARDVRRLRRIWRTFFLTMGDITSEQYTKPFPFFSHQNYEVHQSTTKVVRGLLRNQPRNDVEEIIQNGETPSCGTTQGVLLARKIYSPST